MAYIYNGVQQPISLQEYLTLPLMVKDAYDTAEKQYNDYQDKVAAIKAMSVGIPEAQSEIQAYEDSISDLSDYISNHRYDNKMRIASNNLRDQFRNRVIPISTNITALQKYMQDFSAKDDGTILGRKLGYRDFAENPLRQYQLIQGSAIRNEAAKMAAAASARRIQDLKESRVHGGQYFRTTQETGFSEDDVKNWESIPELSAIRDQLYKAYDSNDFNPAEMDKYIAEGIYLGAQYNKNINDKVNHNYGVSSGSNGNGNGNNIIDWKDVWNRAFEGNGIKPIDRNLFNPSNSNASNGNFIKATSDNGTIILKNPIEMVAAFRATPSTDDNFGKVKELRAVVENLKNPKLRKMLIDMMGKEATGFDRTKYKNQNEALSASISSGTYNKVARITLAELLLRRNSDGSYSLDYNKNTDGSLDISSYKNKLAGGLFSGSRGYFEDIINQIESSGITNKDKFRNLDDFLIKLNSAYNHNNEFRTHGMTTSFALELDENEKERILNNIQGTWNAIGEVSFKNGVMNYNPKPLDEDDKKTILQHYHNGEASVKTEFNQVNGENGPNNFYSAYVEDRTNGKKYHLVFTPEQWNGYTTNYDKMLTYAEYYQLKNIYENGTPEQLQQIGSNNRMSFNEIERQISICIQNNDMQGFEYWNKVLQQAYKNAYDEGLPSAMMQDNQALQAGWNQKSTVIGRHNENSEKANRTAK